jgi:putative ABC transport system permease protein
MVYPQQGFEAQASWNDETHTAKVQALPASFGEQPMFREMVAGRFFAADTALEAVVSRRWLRTMEIDPDSIMGEWLSLKTAGGSELLLGVGRNQMEKMGFSRRLVEEVSDVAAVFLSSLRPNTVVVKVVGIAEIESGFGFRLGSILVPTGTVSNLDYISFSDPVELMTMLSEPPAEGWGLVVVKAENERDYDRVSAEIEAMGYRIFSFLEQMDEIRKSFLVFDVILGAIGLLALFVASLGIVNTMVMSIIERTREIGILKSLGAQESHVRLLFLVESATIGLIGSLGGILLGWLVSRLVSAIIQWYMASQELPKMDMFSLPVWVALVAIGFGVGVSVVAGLYPASRGAGVDPVRALRYE